LIWDLSFLEEILPSFLYIIFSHDMSFVVGNVHHCPGQLNHRFLNQTSLDLSERGKHPIVVVEVPFFPKPVFCILSLSFIIFFGHTSERERVSCDGAAEPGVVPSGPSVDVCSHHDAVVIGIFWVVS